MSTKFILLQAGGVTSYTVPAGKQAVVTASAPATTSTTYYINDSQVWTNSTSGTGLTGVNQKYTVPAGTTISLSLNYPPVVTIIELDVDAVTTNPQKYLPIKSFNSLKEPDVVAGNNSTTSLTAGGNSSALYSKIVSGNGTLVAVRTNSPGGNVAITSNRGVDWKYTALASSTTYASLEYGNGIFITVGKHNSSNINNSISEDGINWRLGAEPVSSTDMNDIAYGNGWFMVITGTSANIIYKTRNGRDWELVLDTVYTKCSAIGYGAGVFVITTETSGILYVSSDMGKTWTNAFASTPTAYRGSSSVDSIAYGNGIFIVVSNDVTPVHTLYVSNDYGKTWTARTVTVSFNNNQKSSISFGNGLFVYNVPGATFYFTSTDGATWTSRAYPVGIASFNMISYANNIFYGFTNTGYMLQSVDGITWEISSTGLPLPITSGNYMKTASLNNMQFLWNTKFLISSSDYISSNINIAPVNKVTDICYGTKYVAVPYNTNTGYTSTNGVSWSQMTLPSVAKWSTVATNGSNLYIAVATNSTQAATSTDGVNWTARVLPTTNEWNGIEYANSIFTLIASDSQLVLTTIDGITWNTNNIKDLPSRIYSINNLFVIICKNQILLSGNGSSWSYWDAPGVIDKSYMIDTTLYIETTNEVLSTVDGYYWNYVDVVNATSLVIDRAADGFIYYDTVNNSIS